MILSFLMSINLHAQSLTWVSGFLRSMVPYSVVAISAVITFYPGRADFITVAELVLLVSFLFWELCQMSSWSLNFAFSVPIISHISFFPSFVNFPLGLRSLNISSLHLDMPPLYRPSSMFPQRHVWGDVVVIGGHRCHLSHNLGDLCLTS